MSYQRTPVSAPRLSGFALRALAALSRTAAGAPIRSRLLAEAGLPRLPSYPVDDGPLQNPLDAAPSAMPAGAPQAGRELAASAARVEDHRGGFRFETTTDYARAYRDGRTNPLEVAERVITAIASSDQGDRPLRAFIAHDSEDLRAQAAKSAERWAAGTPLSIVDGVPVAIKDELDLAPYPTTVGTKVFANARPAARDAEAAARLRAGGALLVGKANMHEIGIGVTGLNPHYGVARNPYDPTRHTGGSSSGPAAAVAAGIGPFSVGADGGGSIRMPSAFCGLVGIKATWSRISERGAAPLTWTVGHVGPLASTTHDAAIAYALMAGEDPEEPITRGRPPVHLDGFGTVDLAGVRLGVYRPWFEDADSDVVSACDAMLVKLREAGATVVDVEIPDLEVVRLAHLSIIASEMYATQRVMFESRGGEYGPDVQINLALAGSVPASTYVHAMRHRARITRLVRDIYGNVDAIVTPTTGCAAPPIPEATLPNGESNLTLLDKIMRYAALANLTGFPAISFPAGYNADGLPIGFQAMARPWEEHLLFRMSHVAEGLVERRRPKVWNSLLPG